MECGKLTAKLRNAVRVCFIENGTEVKRFKNIEIPDEIKKLPYRDFEFSVYEAQSCNGRMSGAGERAYQRI